MTAQPTEAAAEFPDSVSIHALGVDFEDQRGFAMGFNFALRLAAAIASDPFASPDLAAALDKAREAIEESRRERQLAGAA